MKTRNSSPTDQNASKKPKSNNAGTSQEQTKRSKAIEHTPPPLVGTLSTPRQKKSTNVKNTSSPFEAFVQNYNTRIELVTFQTESSEYVVYVWKLYDRNVQYWTHKPTFWSETAGAELACSIFGKNEKNKTLIRTVMNNMTAIPVRAVPSGPNNQEVLHTKSGIDIKVFALCGLANDIEDAKSHVKHFVKQVCSDDRIQDAYAIMVRNNMRNEAFVRDVERGGKYWTKLSAGANAIELKKGTHLNEILMDEQIEERIPYLFPETSGQAPSMWPQHVRDFAYGTLKFDPDETETGNDEEEENEAGEDAEQQD